MPEQATPRCSTSLRKDPKPPRTPGPVVVEHPIPLLEHEPMPNCRYRKNVTLLAVVAAVSLVAAASAATRAGDPSVIIPWHKIGNVSMGMQKQAVEYRYGYSKPTFYDSAEYTVPGGKLIIDYGNKRVGFSNRVISLSTTSPRYKTANGIGVGSTIPLPPCKKVGNLCLPHWNGFTLWHDPTTGAAAWQRYDHYSGKKIVVELIMNGGRVYSISLGACGAAWACNPQTIKG
jgi:hypothetical protein